MRISALQAAAVFAVLGTSFGARAEAVQTIHSYRGHQDGGSPYSDVLLDASGAVYVAAYGGGAGGMGAILRFAPPSDGATTWTETVIHSFRGSPHDGAFPLGNLFMSASGALFGTTSEGGSGTNCSTGCGTAFRLTPPVGGQGPWKETVLHDFTATADGAFPASGLVADRHGNLFGTTDQEAYELMRPAEPGTAWTLTVIKSFAHGDVDLFPNSGLAIDRGGALYGTTYQGGSANDGTVFRLTPPTPLKDKWSLAVLYDFRGGSDGFRPSGVALDADGALFGVTTWGPGAGGVFRLVRPAKGGTPWTFKSLHTFGGSDGAQPAGLLAIGANGHVFGTTTGGGASGCGTVFELAPPAGGGADWGIATLHSFSGRRDGCNSYDGVALSETFGGLVLDMAGYLYGTTSMTVNPLGATYNPAGTVFRLAR